MLASTVQFSTYDQPPTAPPPPAPHVAGGTTDRPVLTETTVARSLRTQQRAYGRPSRRLRSTHTRCAVPGAGSEPAAELVSVPPSSTTPGTGSPLGMSGPSLPWAWLPWATCANAVAGCSLERR